MSVQLSVEVARIIAAEPDYVVPCPQGSLVGVPNVPDLVVRPLIFKGSNSGLTMFAACRVGCPLCGDFRERGWKRGEPVQVNVAGWREFVARESGSEWRAMMADRLRARGLLP